MLKLFNANIPVYLFELNVALKHLRLYNDAACLWQWYFDQCAAKQECHAADTGHPSTPRHSIHTLSCRCAIHWCGTSHWNAQLPIFIVFGQTGSGNYFRPSTHTSERSTLWCWYRGIRSPETAPWYSCQNASRYSRSNHIDASVYNTCTLL